MLLSNKLRPASINPTFPNNQKGKPRVTHMIPSGKQITNLTIQKATFIMQSHQLMKIKCKNLLILYIYHVNCHWQNDLYGSSVRTYAPQRDSKTPQRNEGVFYLQAAIFGMFYFTNSITPGHGVLGTDLKHNRTQNQIAMTLLST